MQCLQCFLFILECLFVSQPFISEFKIILFYVSLFVYAKRIEQIFDNSWNCGLTVNGDYRPFNKKKKDSLCENWWWTVDWETRGGNSNSSSSVSSTFAQKCLELNVQHANMLTVTVIACWFFIMSTIKLKCVLMLFFAKQRTYKFV